MKAQGDLRKPGPATIWTQSLMPDYPPKDVYGQALAAFRSARAASRAAHALSVCDRPD
jgi:hypothetical protein